MTQPIIPIRSDGTLLRQGAGIEVRAHVTSNGHVAVIDWYQERALNTRIMTTMEAVALGEFAEGLLKKERAA